MGLTVVQAEAAALEDPADREDRVVPAEDLAVDAAAEAVAAVVADAEVAGLAGMAAGVEGLSTATSQVSVTGGGSSLLILVRSSSIWRTRL